MGSAYSTAQPTPESLFDRHIQRGTSSAYPEPPTLSIQAGTNIHVYLWGVEGSGTKEIGEMLQSHVYSSKFVPKLSTEKLCSYKLGGDSITSSGISVPEETSDMLSLENASCVPLILSQYNTEKIQNAIGTTATNTVTIFEDNPSANHIILAENLVDTSIMSKSQYSSFGLCNIQNMNIMHGATSRDSMLFVFLDTSIDICAANLASENESVQKLFDKKRLCELRKKIESYFTQTKAICENYILIIKCDRSYALDKDARNFTVLRILSAIDSIATNLYRKNPSNANHALYHPYAHLASHDLKANNPNARNFFSTGTIGGIIESFTFTYEPPKKILTFNAQNTTTQVPLDLISNSTNDKLAEAVIMLSTKYEEQQKMLVQQAQKVDELLRRTSTQIPFNPHEYPALLSHTEHVADLHIDSHPSLEERNPFSHSSSELAGISSVDPLNAQSYLEMPPVQTFYQSDNDHHSF